MAGARRTAWIAASQPCNEHSFIPLDQCLPLHPHSGYALCAISARSRYANRTRSIHFNPVYNIIKSINIYIIVSSITL